MSITSPQDLTFGENTDVRATRFHALAKVSASGGTVKLKSLNILANPSVGSCPMASCWIFNQYFRPPMSTAVPKCISWTVGIPSCCVLITLWLSSVLQQASGSYAGDSFIYIHRSGSAFHSTMLLKDPWDRLLDLGITSQKEISSITELMLMTAKHGVLACRIDLEKVRQSTPEYVRDGICVIQAFIVIYQHSDESSSFRS